MRNRARIQLKGILLIQHYFIYILKDSRVQQYLNIIISGKINTAIVRVTVGIKIINLKYIKKKGILKPVLKNKGSRSCL